MNQIPPYEDGYQEVRLFGPGLNPSMNSSLDPTAIADGEFAELLNLRFSERVARARWGSQDKFVGQQTLAALFEGEPEPRFRGWIYDEHTGILFVAAAVGSETWIVAYVPSNEAWVEVTSNAFGKFGTTRFQTADEKVHFALVTEPHFLGTTPFSSLSEHRYLIAQVGSQGESPRVVFSLDDPELWHGSAIHRAIISPDQSAATYTNVPWKTFDTSIGAGLLTTIDISYTNGGSQTVNESTFIRATFLAGCDAGRKVTFSGFTAVTIEGGTELHLVCEPSIEDIWQFIKVGLRKTNGDIVWIYDPSGAEPDLSYWPTVVSAGGDATLVAFNLGAASLLQDQFDGVRFEWVSDADAAADYMLDLFLIAFSRGRSGGSQFGVSFFNARSRAESQGIVCQFRPQQNLKAIGGSHKAGVGYPDSPSCFYTYEVSVAQPDIQDLSPGDDSILVYCSPYKSEQFYLVSGISQDLSVHEIGSTWTYPTGLSNPEPVTVTAGTLRRRLILNSGITTRTMVTTPHEVIPPGKAMAYASGRLYVASPRWDVNSLIGRGAAVSDPVVPFRFSRLPVTLTGGTISPNSPLDLSLGGEVVEAFFSPVGVSIGSDSVVALTSKSAWQMSGSDAQNISRPQRVASHGTFAPWSVAEYQNVALWVDPSMQVRTLGLGVNSPSRSRVEDKLARIPNGMRESVSGAVFDEKYYLSFAQGDVVENTNVLIYDLRSGTWIMDSPALSARPAGFLAIHENGKEMLLAISETLRIFEYESEGVADSVDVWMLTKAYSGNLFDMVGAGPVGVVADRVDASSVRVRRKGISSGFSAREGTISLAGTGGQLVMSREDVDEDFDPPAPIEILDQAVQYELLATVPGGTKIYNVVAQVRVIEGGQHA